MLLLYVFKELDIGMSETEKKCNPSPLGLLGFGMTTIVLNLHNVGLIPLSGMILAMGIFVGGFAQLIAGIFEFKHHNTFGGTAFVAYGSFWLSLVAIWVNPFGAIAAANELAMGCYLLLWGLFTLFMFIATLKHNRISQIVFGTLVLLFLLLAIADFTGVGGIKIAAGVVGIICGLSAMYSSAGQIINTEFGKKILPLI